MSAQGIMNIGSTSDGSVEKDGHGGDRSRGRTIDRPNSANLKTETGGTAVTPLLVCDS